MPNLNETIGGTVKTRNRIYLLPRPRQGDFSGRELCINTKRVKGSGKAGWPGGQGIKIDDEYHMEAQQAINTFVLVH